MARLGAAYRSGELTPEEMMAEVLRRIASAGDDHVWISRPTNGALIEQARALSRRWSERAALPLYGLPFAVKDSIDVAGLPTTLACPAYSFKPARSATVISRLLDAGAMLVGKTNLDQFATGLVGVRSPYGIPRNPFDPTMIPGGSSSGSAVAVSSGLVSFAIATDTAGSGRVPAAFNNIVGYKPSRGLFSMNGLTPACRSADCVTVMALTIEDALRVSRVMQGYDSSDPYSRHPPAHFDLTVGVPPKEFAFGVPQRDQLQFFTNAEAESLFDKAINRVTALGGRMIEVDYSPWTEASQMLYGPWVAERMTDLGDFVEAHAGEIHPVVRDIILGGRRFSAVELFRAQHRLAELGRTISPVWQTIDFLLVPTTGTAYSINDILADPVRKNTNLGFYTNFANLLDLAVIAIPGGFNSKSFPFGISLVGPAWSDTRLLGYADAIQQALDLPPGISAVPPVS